MKADNNREPATKGDLTKLETMLKGDLAELKTAFKDDLAGLRTEVKGDLAELKTELDGKMKNVYLETIKLQSRVANIEEKMSTKDDINRILSAIDKFAGMADNYKRKDMERGHMLMEQHDKLQDHETRLTALETEVK